MLAQRKTWGLILQSGPVMFMRWSRCALALAALAAVALAGAPVQASCSRPLQVPVAPIGLSVIVADSQISGVYPDVMRMLGQSCRFQFDPVPLVVVNRQRMHCIARLTSQRGNNHGIEPA